jgi:hypothetical protein
MRKMSFALLAVGIEFMSLEMATGHLLFFNFHHQAQNGFEINPL